MGLLVNPQIHTKDNANADLIRSRWQQLYQTYNNSFNPLNYNINPTDKPVIDQNGFLQIPWTEEMNDFDFLLATPTIPYPHRVLSANEIADRMNTMGHWSYFTKNVEHGIKTFQDSEILQLQNMRSSHKS